MNVRVCRSHDDPIVVIKQQEAVQPIGPSFHREKEPEQTRAVSDDEGKGRPVLDEGQHAIGPIDSAGHESTRDDDQQHPILERNVGGKREEIDADVLSEDWIALSVWRLVNEAQGYLPVAGFAQSYQSCENDRNPRDEETPGEALK